MVVNSQGLGFTVDLNLFDEAVNIPSTPAQAEMFDSPGSFWHVLLGMAAGFLPGAWPVLGASTFGAYELSKVEGGKPFPKISGAILEFALGMTLAGLILIVRVK